PRTDPRLHPDRGLERLGPGLGPHAAVGDPRPDHRTPFAYAWRRHLSIRVRSPAGADRPPGRPDRAVQQEAGNRRSSRLIAPGTARNGLSRQRVTSPDRDKSVVNVNGRL